MSTMNSAGSSSRRKIRLRPWTAVRVRQNDLAQGPQPGQDVALMLGVPSPCCWRTTSP
jgi:hypothetical protein